MKKYFFVDLFLSLMVFSPYLFGQNKKCRFDKDTEDPITGQKMLFSEYQNFYKLKAKGSAGVQIKVTGSEITIFLAYIFITDVPQPFAIEKDAQVIILLDNKDTVSLKAVETIVGAPGQKLSGETDFLTSVENSFVLNKTQLTKLKSSPVKMVRFILLYPNKKIRPVDVYASEKMNTAFIDLVMCIETRLN